MLYDLLITKIDRSHKNTLAKLLCADPSVSLQKALSMLENLPVTYKTGLKKEDAKRELEKLKLLGAVVTPIESKIKEDPIEEILNAEEEESKVDKKVEEKKTTPPQKEYSSERAIRAEVKSSKNRTISRIGPPAKKKKKSNLTGVIVLLAAIAGFGILITTSTNRKEYKINSDSSLLKKSSSSSKTSKTPEKKKSKNLNIFSAMKEKKEKEKAQKVSDSKNYADSAEMFIDDPEAMIKFYKIAISINRKNFNAWNGLVNAYANQGMTKEAYEAKKEMEKIFGDEMFSVEKLVRPYGKLVSFNQESGGLCRLEYKSDSQKRTTLENDCYKLLKALQTSLGCSNYSLYASTGKGTGLLVRFSEKSFPNSFSDFLLQAKINYIE